MTEAYDPDAMDAAWHAEQEAREQADIDAEELKRKNGPWRAVPAPFGIRGYQDAYDEGVTPAPAED